MVLTSHNFKCWKQLYNGGRESLIALLYSEAGDLIYETFGIMINSFEIANIEEKQR